MRYEVGGQLYGTMEGDHGNISGKIDLTNLALQRHDNVKCPTLRGVLTTDDGATIYVELVGLANLRASDNARVFASALTFRTGQSTYAWLNTVLAVLEGVLDQVQVGGTARVRAYQWQIALWWTRQECIGASLPGC